MRELTEHEKKLIEIGFLYGADNPSVRLAARDALAKLANLTPLDAECKLREIRDGD